MKKIYLFRHSMPDRNSTLKNEYIPLSHEGENLIKQLFDKINITFHIKVYSSTYLRAK